MIEQAPSVDMAAGMKVAAPIVTATINQTLAILKTASSSISERVARELRIGYSDFLIASYNRCQRVKTIVSGDEPVPLLDVYVNLNLSCNDDTVIDDDLIQNLERYKRIVISGTGGAGKSMLMKYLTISRFENSKGKIPLFIELRNLNNLTKKELLQYCFSSCSTFNQKVNFSSFENVFSAGGFVLILDGFDEIEPEYKEDIERQILEIGRKHPDSVIIVSSRNDVRFKGWQDYYIFEVNKLNQRQVKSLITKVRSNSGIQKRFLKELPALWITHETFLSIPLLAAIMLLTFGKFSEISPKATLFYRLAFQTLFREHDANKEQFKRPIYSKLDLDDFERSFAAFCALSYLDNKISFDDALAKTFSDQARDYARLQFKSNDYIRDLVENVCMLQQEGTDLTFVHRSFQEYFSAVFLVGYHEKNLFEVINEIALRENDSTLAMFKELDEAKFEISWLVPLLESYIPSLEAAVKTKSPSVALNWIFKAGLYDENLHLNALMVSESGRSAIMRSLAKVYPEEQKILSLGNIFMALQIKDFRGLLAKNGADKRKSVEGFLRNLDEKGSRFGTNELNFSEEEDDWLAETKILDTMKGILKGLKNIQSKVVSGRKIQSGIVRIG